VGYTAGKVEGTGEALKMVDPDNNPLRHYSLDTVGIMHWRFSTIQDVAMNGSNQNGIGPGFLNPVSASSRGF